MATLSAGQTPNASAVGSDTAAPTALQVSASGKSHVPVDDTCQAVPQSDSLLYVLLVPAAYVVGQAGTASCPVGSSEIASASACQSAAVATGRTYSGTTASASRPRGCYVFTTANTVWFNTDPAGGGTLSTSSPLCFASTADSPSAVPDLSSTSPSPLVAPSGSTAAPLVAGTAAPSSAVPYCQSGTARCGTASCSGTWITTKAECELAAVALNAESQTATLSIDAVQPRGCYLYRISTLIPIRSLRFNSVGTEMSFLSSAWAICRLGGEGRPTAHKTSPEASCGCGEIALCVRRGRFGPTPCSLSLRLLSRAVWYLDFTAVCFASTGASPTGSPTSAPTNVGDTSPPTRLVDPCIYARDGACDVPSRCPVGDWEDCSTAGTQLKPPHLLVAMRD